MYQCVERIETMREKRNPKCLNMLDGFKLAAGTIKE